jgi:hypothetical protein
MLAKLLFVFGGFLKSYIFRIYRQQKNNPQSIVGIVEEPEQKGENAFNTYDELWEILNSGSKETGWVRARKKV